MKITHNHAKCKTAAIGGCAQCVCLLLYFTASKQRYHRNIVFAARNDWMACMHVSWMRNRKHGKRPFGQERYRERGLDSGTAHPNCSLSEGRLCACDQEMQLQLFLSVDSFYHMQIRSIFLIIQTCFI